MKFILNILLVTVIQLLKYLSKNNAIRIISNLDLETFKCNNVLNLTYPSCHVKRMEDPDCVWVRAEFLNLLLCAL
jgi:hypothetical protein